MKTVPVIYVHRNGRLLALSQTSALAWPFEKQWCRPKTALSVWKLMKVVPIG